MGYGMDEDFFDRNDDEDFVSRYSSSAPRVKKLTFDDLSTGEKFTWKNVSWISPTAVCMKVAPRTGTITFKSDPAPHGYIFMEGPYAGLIYATPWDGQAVARVK